MPWRGLHNYKWKRRNYWLLALLLIIGYLWWPIEIPQAPTSTVLNDRNGNLLSASIAEDEQWRFPIADSVPHKLEQCILNFEDEYFYYHSGINPISLVRATYQNIRSGKVVSGASTLTMQIARMMRDRERTVWQKLIEMQLALQLEFSYTKTELLQYYVSMAPFGGNVVGVNAASWRYFGRPPHLLSWGESATLAVLPNQPGAIYPGTKMETLKNKRDFLLEKLLKNGLIDSLTYELSVDEPLPDRPFDIPQNALHLLTTYRETHNGEQLTTTLGPFWQSKTTEVVERKQRRLRTNGVDNLAVLVVDLNDGQVLSYVGNTTNQTADGYQVDVIQRPRSSGSILKPLLYAKSLDDGLILPETLLPDIPSFFGGYSPKNFNRGYEGAIKADQALSRSLNIPFTHLLQDYKYEKFHQDLKKFGLTTLQGSPGHYGLSMILGGAEVKLWDLAQVYFSLYRRLANEDNYKIHFDGNTQKLPDVDLEEINIWHTFQAMTELSRPGTDQNWENFSSSQRIAWKTGTSIGFRDAWAVGLNGNILVAVWVGNADGEGRAGLTGSGSAGPILTELIRLSDYDPSWLEGLKPFSSTKEVCNASGMLASENCPDTKSMDLGSNAELSGLCTYHQSFWVDESETHLVNRSCYSAEKAKEKSLFILPPTMGYYYKKTHSNYAGIPSFLPGCGSQQRSLLAITYPTPNAKVFIPRELTGTSSEVIIEASHQDPNAELFWHINEDYIGTTSGEHKQSLLLGKGVYNVVILDQHGNSVKRSFEVVSDQQDS